MRDLGYSPARIRKEAMKILNADKNYRQTVAKNTLEYKKDIKQLIEDITKRAYLEGDMLIAAAGRMAWVDDLSIWKSAGKSLKGKSFLSQLVNAMAEQTRGVMKNLTRTTAFSTQSGMESIKNLYQNELDKATIKICSGTFSQEKVMNDLIHELSQSGLRTVNFDTGRSMQLDTAAKLAVRTGCHQLSGKVHNQNMKDTGCNLMYVAEHEGARNVGTGIANHEEWQGKVYYVRPGKDYSEEASRVGQDQIRDIWEETGYSPDGAYVNDPRGLYGYNCRHTCYVWFEGISEKPEPIKKIEPISYKGKTYDRYAVTQKMRAMERGIRALKREKAALTSLGMDTKEISVKIKEHIYEYGKFCDAAKVPHSKYNIRYDGSSGDLTKTKAYQRYHTMVEDSLPTKENERITKNIQFAVDSKVIDSREYADKFNHITSDGDVKREMLKNAKEMLRHRSGQNGEDLYLYNTRTKVWTKSTTGTEAGTPEYTKEIFGTIDKAEKGELISFHNHPASMPPSAADINSALINGYGKGYTLCHDGKIFEYTASEMVVSETSYNIHIAKYKNKGYNEFESQMRAIQELSELYGFVVKEVE